MKSEYVLLVDKNDKIIGKEEKVKAHKEALLHSLLQEEVIRKCFGQEGKTTRKLH